MKYLNNLIFLTILLSYCVVNAQKQVTVKYISEPINIDAVLDEPAWQLADKADKFWQYFPSDSIQSKQQSEIKMLFDDNYLYVGIKVFASGNDYVIPSLRRDFRAVGSDNISFIF